MKAEDKQEIIDHCEVILDTHSKDSVLYNMATIALSALTAQPVKLAKDLKLSDKAHQSHCDYAEGYNDRAEMDRSAIRAAGYEVTE